MKPLLQIQNLTKTFGGLKAVQKIDLTLEPQQILSIIGPNGAGKTTLFNCISGIYKPTEGAVTLEEKEIHGLAPFQICRRGIARTFQNIRLFPEMSALENVMVGHFRHRRLNPFRLLARTPAYRREENESRSIAEELLRFVDLGNHTHDRARNLAYGLQRRLEIARAMATQPKVLLLDEPAAGMNPRESEAMVELIQKIKNRGLSVLLIEHHMKVVMRISDRIMVLDHGERIAFGTPEQVRVDPKVISAYLGKESHA